MALRCIAFLYALPQAYGFVVRLQPVSGSRSVRMMSDSDGGFLSTLRGKVDVKPGDQVIASNDWNSSSPEYGIVRAQTYQLQRVYYQGVVDNNVQRVDVERLEAAPPSGCAGFTKYLVLYSTRYHAETGPVIVRPTEVQVVAIKDEIADSAWLALPGLFWVWVAYTFYEYGVSTGRL